MKAIIKQLACIGLSATIMYSSAMLVFAAEEQPIIPNHNAKTQVSANVDSSAVVWLPTSVVLSGKANEQHKYTAEYGVRVEGNIAGNEKIKIVPDESVVLKQEGKEDITATITQEKQEFTYSDLKAGATSTSTGTITANSLSAGSWNGSFNFNVTFTNTEKELGKKIKSWDISKDRSNGDDVWLTYYDPSQIQTKVNKRKTRTSIVDKYENGTVVISGTGEMEEDISQKYFYDYEKLVSDHINKLKEQFPNCEFYPLGTGISTTDKFVYQGIKDVYNQKIKLLPDNPTFEDYKKVFGNIVFYKLGDWNTYSTYGNYFTFAGFRLSEQDSGISNANPVDIYSNNGNISGNMPLPECFTNGVSISNELMDKTDKLIYKKFNAKKVIIKDGVTNISEGAFRNMNELTDIDIAPSIKQIYNGCFDNTSIKELHITGKVDNFNLSFMPKLKKLVFENVKNTSNDSVIYLPISKENVDNIYIPDYCGLLYFNDNNINNISIPCSTNQGFETGLRCNINTLSIRPAESNEIKGNYNGNLIWSYLSHNFDTNNSIIQNIVLEEGITKLCNNSFYNYINKEIKLPKTTTELEEYVFSGNRLETIYIPANVKKVGNNVFDDCNKLKTIYCENEIVAQLFRDKGYSDKIVVDSSLFNY